MRQQTIQTNNGSSSLGNEIFENLTNIVDFPAKLEQLRNKRKTTSENSHSNKRCPVADVLDRTTPNWTHSIKKVQEMGASVLVIAAVTIDGTTREGIGTCSIETEKCVEKAELDALKNAAVKFDVARDTYICKIESAEIEEKAEPYFTENPMAKSLSDLITAKQLGMIRKLSSEKGIDADAESNRTMFCEVNELSKQAASSLIQYLQEINPIHSEANQRTQFYAA